MQLELVKQQKQRVLVENRSQLDIISELITTVSNTTIQGVVMQIQSVEIILLGVVFSKLQKIKTKLNGHDSMLAVQAYEKRLPILCTGDLIKENNTFILKNSYNFTLDNHIIESCLI